MPNLNNDCFRVRYAAIALGFICLVEAGGEIASAYGFKFLFFMPIVLIFIAMLVYTVIAFLYNLIKLNWKRLLSMLAAVLAAFSLISLQYHAGLTPDYLRFVLVRPYYIAQVNEMLSAPISFKAWFWDETGGGVTSHELDVLVYDETEQLLLSPELRTDEWINAVEACSNYAELDLSAIASSGRTRNWPRNITIKVLGGHFFLVSH